MDERLKYLLTEYHSVLPSIVFARLFDVSEKEVLGLHGELGIELSTAEARRILREFLEGEYFQNLAHLNGDEQREVRLIRHELRLADERQFEERRMEMLVEEFSDQLPTAVLARMFDVPRHRIQQVRERLGVAVAKGEATALWWRFINAEHAPQIEVLEAREQGVVNRIWREMRRDYETKRKSEAKTQEKTLRAVLTDERDRLRALRGDDPDWVEVACTGECGLSWPRVSFFFPKSPTSSDGLAGKCKLCVFLRTSRARLARKRKRAKRPTLKGKAREHVREVIKRHGNEIPKQLILELFDISSVTLETLRKEVDLVVSRDAADSLKLWWVTRDSVPTLRALTSEELSRLYLIWKKFKSDFWTEFEEGDGRLQLMRLEREKLRTSGSDILEKPCKGGCGEQWHETDFFFQRRYGKNSGFSNLCLHCYNLGRRRRRLNERVRKLEELYGQEQQE